MNLILVQEADFIGENRIRLKGRRFKHIRDVHGAAPGDRLRVGLCNGKIGHGQVTAIHEASIELDIELNHDPPPPSSIKLLLALPRPKNLSRILQTITSQGIKEIHLFHSYQVEKSFWQSDLLSAKNLHTSFLLGLEQARDTVVPTVQMHKRFKPFVEDQVPKIIKEGRALIAHPVGGSPCPADVNEPITLAVGPEGGFLPYEVHKFSEQGFEVTGLSSRILKVETALSVLIGRLSV